MKHGGMRWLWVVILLVSVLAACGGDATPASNTGATSESAVSEESEPVEKLVIDFDVFDPDAYYTFDNPGGWTIYQQLNLSDPDESVSVGVLVSTDETLSFADYIKNSWTDADFEAQETADGWTYTIMKVAETPSIFVESPDGKHWSFQIHKRADDADPDSFIDTVLKIALSATYIPRETEE